MSERVVALLEVVDVAYENGESLALLPEARDFVVETLHQRAMVRQTGKAVRGRQQLELVVFLAQSLVDAIELGATVTQTVHHVVEDVGQIADLSTARRCWQVDGQVTGGDFARCLRQSIQRSRDQHAESV